VKVSEAVVSGDAKDLVEKALGARLLIMGQPMMARLSCQAPKLFGLGDFQPDLSLLLDGFLGLLGEFKRPRHTAIEEAGDQLYGYLLTMVEKNPDAFGPYFVVLMVTGGHLRAQIVSFDPVGEELIFGEALDLVNLSERAVPEHVNGFFAKIALACVKRIEWLKEHLTPRKMQKARLSGVLGEDEVRQPLELLLDEVGAKTAEFGDKEAAEGFGKLMEQVQWDRKPGMAPCLPYFLPQECIRKKGGRERLVVKTLLAGGPEQPKAGDLKWVLAAVMSGVHWLHERGLAYCDVRQRNVAMGLLQATLLDLDGSRGELDVADLTAALERDWRLVFQEFVVPHLREFGEGGALAGENGLARVLLWLEVRPQAELDNEEFLNRALLNLRAAASTVFEVRAVVLEHAATPADCVAQIEANQGAGKAKRRVLVVVEERKTKGEVEKAVAVAKLGDVTVLTVAGESWLAAVEPFDLIVVAARMNYPRYVHVLGRLKMTPATMEKSKCISLLSRVDGRDAREARYVVRQIADLGGEVPEDLRALSLSRVPGETKVRRDFRWPG
jgi:hypothetical protein